MKKASPDWTCFLVGVAGLEPAASWSRTKHATKLRYTPTTQEIFYRIRRELSRADLENPAGSL